MSRTRSNAVSGAVKTGDILIKYNAGGLTGNAIQFGQLFSKGKSKYIHSAIATSPTTVVEMSGCGLHESNLLTDNAPYTYDLFRCRLHTLAEGAAEVAKLMMGFVHNAGSGDFRYSMKGAIGSLFGKSSLGNKDRINKILDNLLAGGAENYFCSGHTVLCYAVAMEQTNIHVQSCFPVEKMRSVFGYENTGYNPSYLHDHLSKSDKFTAVGTIRSAQLVA